MPVETVTNANVKKAVPFFWGYQHGSFTSVLYGWKLGFEMK